MKLGYYHYFFKERHRRNAPRVCLDIRPILRTYLEYGDTAWKTQFESDDGEKLLLMPTPTSSVFMLVATRHQEIIKAIHTRTLSCADLSERLRTDETTGFAAYFRPSEHAMGLASTLRGPKTAALGRFINEIIGRLGAGAWQLHVQAVGSSVTLEQARGMAFVARTTIKVGPQNATFQRLKELFAQDSEDIGSFEVTIRGKRNRNLRDVFRAMSREASGDDLERMTIRAKAALDEDLSDFFVEADGKLSEEIGPGTENQITQSVSTRFSHHPKLAELLDAMMEGAVYEDRSVPELARLGDIAHWRSHLRAE